MDHDKIWNHSGIFVRFEDLTKIWWDGATAVRVVTQAFSEAPKGAWSKAAKTKQSCLCLSQLVFHCEQSKYEKEQNNKWSRYKETLSQSNQGEPRQKWTRTLYLPTLAINRKTEEMRDIFTQMHKKENRAKQINWDRDQGWWLVEWATVGWLIATTQNIFYPASYIAIILINSFK